MASKSDGLSHFRLKSKKDGIFWGLNFRQYRCRPPEIKESACNSKN